MPFQFRKEAIEEDLNTNFPSQGQGNPPLYYSLSEVVVPTYSINAAAEGSLLGQNLQTALDFATTNKTAAGNTQTIANTAGFYLIYHNVAQAGGGNGDATLRISDGISSKTIFKVDTYATTDQVTDLSPFVVFLRSGDTLTAVSSAGDCVYNVSYRQIATSTGQLVNPLGFSFA